MSHLKKKIAVIGAPFEIVKGGAELQYSMLENELKEKYDFYYVFPESATEGMTLSNNVTFKRSFIASKLYYKYSRFTSLDIPKIYHCLSHIRPDIIYSQQFDNAMVASVLYAKNHNISSIWHIASERCVWPSKSQRRHSLDFLGPFLIRYIIKNVTSIIGQTNDENTLLSEHWGRTCDFIVPNWHPIPKDSITKKNPLIIIWVGNLKMMKQPEMFIQLAEDNTHLEDVQFVMIGRKSTGHWHQELMHRIDQCPNLSYLGEKSFDDVNKIIDDSGIMVSTSLYEGFPNTYIQAWLRNVPVVALKVNPDNVITSNHVGFCSGSYEKLLKDVRKLSTSPALRNEMGNKAREYASKYHDVKKNAAIMENIFERSIP